MKVLGVCAALLALALRPALAETVSAVIREPAKPPQSTAVQRGPTVVYLLLDGFRFDYVDKFDLKVMKALRAEGAWAPDGMFPSYPSISGPNHVALLTGLLPTHSGIIANSFLDVARDKDHAQYGLAQLYDGSFYHGTPIWEGAERAGIRTAGMIWTGLGIDSHGVRMSHVEEFTGDESIVGAPQIALFKRWLDLPPAKRPHFYAIQLAQADHVGHQFGTNSPELATAAHTIDDEIGEIRDALKRKGIRADIVIVADHGMSDVQGDWVDLDRFADFSHARSVGSLIYPESEAVAERIYQQLKGASATFDVYRRADLPPWLHYSDRALVGDPVIVPRGPYLIRVHDDGHGGDAHPDLKGWHGPWVGNSAEMRATFIAAGPHIRSGVRVEPFRNLDVYPMVSTLLGLPASPSDGTCLLADQILNGSPHCASQPWASSR